MFFSVDSASSTRVCGVVHVMCGVYGACGCISTDALRNKMVKPWKLLSLNAITFSGCLSI